MKKIYNIFIATVVAAVAFTSCNDDDVYVEDPTANQLTILSRETSFGAAPSQGAIVVDTNEPLTVTSNDQTGWITTSVDGNKVIVNVDMNGSLDGRTAMLTIKGGEKQAQVSVIQSGVIVALDGDRDVAFNDNARTLTYTVKANIPVDVSTEDDWISPVYEDGVLTITLAANNTGHMRVGAVSIVAGPVSDEIGIVQMDFNKDLAADDYMLLFVDPKDGKTKYFNAELKRTGTKYSLELPDTGLSIPLTYTTSTMELKMAAGEYLGDINPYKMHTVMWDTESGYLTWDQTVSMSAVWSYEEENGEGTTIGEFMDNGSWSGYNVDALRLEAFSGTPATKANRLNIYLARMVYPTLVRFHEVPSAKASNATSVAKSYAATPRARKIASIETAVPYEFTEFQECEELQIAE